MNLDQLSEENEKGQVEEPVDENPFVWWER